MQMKQAVINRLFGKKHQSDVYFWRVFLPWQITGSE